MDASVRQQDGAELHPIRRQDRHGDVEKEDDEGVHHATVATVTGEGESTSLESYGTCAVALYAISHHQCQTKDP